jgi:hypothetical protein
MSYYDIPEDVRHPDRDEPGPCDDGHIWYIIAEDAHPDRGEPCECGGKLWGLSEGTTNG